MTISRANSERTYFIRANVGPFNTVNVYITIRYDTIKEFNVDSKADYTA